MRVPKRPNILVVDDDPISQKLTEVMLRTGGFNVQLSSNGQEALDLLDRGFRPAVILLDLRMPVLDGAGFYRLFLERQAVKVIPVIGLSGVDEAVDFEVMVKPVNRERLLARLHSVINARPAKKKRRPLRWIAAIIGVAGAVRAILEYLGRDKR